MTKYSKHRAVEALKALLEQMSAIKLRDIKFDSPGSDCRIDILAQIDVYGHSHTLACKVTANGQPKHVCMALKELQDHIAQLAPGATPVFIAPYLPEEAQALCRESDAGFLDLQGNAHLVLNEVFIVKRSLPHHKPHRSSTSPTRTADPSVLQGLPPVRSETPLHVVRIATRGGRA
jgi:hypothetical protein